jgi:hypothetical protein
MNPYATLGLDKATATPEKVKRAYRRKAAKAHPDQAQPEGDFHAIAKAYKVLADPTAKKIYDECGVAMGEDPLQEEAIMLLINTSAEILARNPDGDLPRMLRASMIELRAQSIATVKAVEKCITQVEKRWTGAEVVRDALLMNMRGRVIQMNRRTTACDRAKQLLEGVQYMRRSRMRLMRC